jgi:hypothetical protein
MPRVDPGRLLVLAGQVREDNPRNTFSELIEQRLCKGSILCPEEPELGLLRASGDDLRGPQVNVSASNLKTPRFCSTRDFCSRLRTWIHSCGAGAFRFSAMRSEDATAARTF